MKTFVQIHGDKAVQRSPSFFARRAMLACALALAAPLALAQAYPNKPVRLLVGYNAGGGACPPRSASRWSWRTARARAA